MAFTTRPVLAMTAVVAVLPLLLLCVGCGGPRVVPLLASAGVPLTSTPSRQIPLEVVTRSTQIKDPVPVSGSRLAYGDFETALGIAVSSAAVPWAVTHQNRRPGGWQLYVEMTDAEVEYDGARFVVNIQARATLRTRIGGTHIGQVEAGCNDAGVVPLDKGASIVYACMMHLGRDLTAWLDAAEPEARVVAADSDSAKRGSGAVGPSGEGASPIYGGGGGDGDGDGASDGPGEGGGGAAAEGGGDGDG